LPCLFEEDEADFDFHKAALRRALEFE